MIVEMEVPLPIFVVQDVGWEGALVVVGVVFGLSRPGEGNWSVSG